MPIERIDTPFEAKASTLDAGTFNAYEPQEYRNILVKASGTSESPKYLDCTDCIYHDWMILNDGTKNLDILMGKSDPPAETPTPLDQFHSFMKNLPADADVLQSVKTAFSFISANDDQLLKFKEEFEQHPAFGNLLALSQPEYNRVADKLNPDLIGTLAGLPSLKYSGQERKAQKSMETLRNSVSGDALRDLEAYFAKLETVETGNPKLVDAYKGAYDRYYESAITSSYMYDALKTFDVGKKYFKGN